MEQQSEPPKKLSKAARRRKRKKNRTIAADNGKDFKPKFPFQAEALDHCESPIESYKDINVFLQSYAKSIGKSKSTISIYDPYFCNGSIKRNLGKLGYNKVYNKCEDFYEKIEKNEVPEYDVLITNPPYSSDHIEKLLYYIKKMVQTKGKPFFLLLPNYVYTKQYYKDIMKEINLFYYVPIKFRYYYNPPDWVDKTQGSSALLKGKTSTSPYHSFWYIYGGNDLKTKAFVKEYFRNISKTNEEKTQYKNRIEMLQQRIALCQHVKEIPYELRGELDTQKKKRPNPRARKRSRSNNNSTGGNGNKKNFQTMYNNAKRKKTVKKKKVYNFI
eukprot:g3007.t1